MSDHDDDRVVLERAFPVELSEGDGRTIDMRVMPYGVVARVADPPRFEPYNETWDQGVFERQTTAAHRVKVFLNVEHEEGLRGIIGHGLELVDRGDALYGSFRVHPNADGDKALHLVREGLLGGVSVEAFPLRSKRVDGVVHRVRAHLDKVSLVRDAAFTEAAVLAVRNAPLDDSEGEGAGEGEPGTQQPVTPAEPRPPATPPAEGEGGGGEGEGGEQQQTELERRLALLGFEPMVRRAITRVTWDGSPSRFTDEQYQRSCLIDRAGDAPIKERCSLPVLEPNGDVNVHALAAAAGALAGARGGLTNVSLAQRASAARKLVRYYAQAGMTPPPGLRALATR